MKIIRAEHLGMCFGVRDAITLAVNEAAVAPLTILGELVHNETVIAGLRARGITIQNDVGGVATQKVMITAHGTSQHVLNQVRARGLNVVEATCPLVHAAHRAVAELARQCDVVVVIGGAHSNNTQELVKTCRRHCPRVQHVQSAVDLRPEWFVGAATVGITAGTSTPDSVIDEVEACLAALDGNNAKLQMAEAGK